MGVDLESVISGEMLTQASIALGMQQALDSEAHRAAAGTIPETTTITTLEALGWVTIEGACCVWKIGSDRLHLASRRTS